MTAPAITAPPVYDPHALKAELELVDPRVEVEIVHPWVPLHCTVCQFVYAFAAVHMCWDEPGSIAFSHADACVECAVEFLADWVVPGCGDTDVHRAPIDVQVWRWAP